MSFLYIAFIVIVGWIGFPRSICDKVVYPTNYNSNIINVQESIPTNAKFHGSLKISLDTSNVIDAAVYFVIYNKLFFTQFNISTSILDADLDKIEPSLNGCCLNNNEVNEFTIKHTYFNIKRATVEISISNNINFDQYFTFYFYSIQPNKQLPLLLTSFQAYTFINPAGKQISELNKSTNAINFVLYSYVKYVDTTKVSTVQSVTSIKKLDIPTLNTVLELKLLLIPSPEPYKGYIVGDDNIFSIIPEISLLFQMSFNVTSMTFGLLYCSQTFEMVTYFIRDIKDKNIAYNMCYNSQYCIVPLKDGSITLNADIKIKKMDATVTHLLISFKKITIIDYWKTKDGSPDLDFNELTSTQYLFFRKQMLDIYVTTNPTNLINLQLGYKPAEQSTLPNKFFQPTTSVCTSSICKFVIDYKSLKVYDPKLNLVEIIQLSCCEGNANSKFVKSISFNFWANQVDSMSNSEKTYYQFQSFVFKGNVAIPIINSNLGTPTKLYYFIENKEATEIFISTIENKEKPASMQFITQTTAQNKYEISKIDQLYSSTLLQISFKVPLFIIYVTLKSDQSNYTSTIYLGKDLSTYLTSSFYFFQVNLKDDQTSPPTGCPDKAKCYRVKLPDEKINYLLTLTNNQQSECNTNINTKNGAITSATNSQIVPRIISQDNEPIIIINGDCTSSPIFLIRASKSLISRFDFDEKIPKYKFDMSLPKEKKKIINLLFGLPQDKLVRVNDNLVIRVKCTVFIEKYIVALLSSPNEASVYDLSKNDSIGNLHFNKELLITAPIPRLDNWSLLVSVLITDSTDPSPSISVISDIILQSSSTSVISNFMLKDFYSFPIISNNPENVCLNINFLKDQGQCQFILSAKSDNSSSAVYVSDYLNPNISYKINNNYMIHVACMSLGKNYVIAGIEIGDPCSSTNAQYNSLKGEEFLSKFDLLDFTCHLIYIEKSLYNKKSITLESYYTSITKPVSKFGKYKIQQKATLIPKLQEDYEYYGKFFCKDTLSKSIYFHNDEFAFSNTKYTTAQPVIDLTTDNQQRKIVIVVVVVLISLAFMIIVFVCRKKSKVKLEMNKN